MIASMTGFGRGEAEAKGFTVTVEMRSVNSRYCEVSTRTPKSLTDRENDIARYVKETFSRGRISIQVQVEEATADKLQIRVDGDAVEACSRLLEDVRRAAGLEAPVRLDHILKFSEIFVPVDPPGDAADIAWDATQDALREACDDLKRMRREEGKALHAELAERLDGITSRLEEIERLAPARVPSAQERMRERLAEILEDDRIDHDRIEFEMAMLADKLDVREECVRLKSHVNLFRQALASGEPVGRKLNFLSQEMNREINTIGSKSNDADMSHLVVGMKEELEKIKEQIENVE
ncbi:MAG: YicC family protein [Rhodothermales bacterium]|nr:YicC family protein [Rhodothermales bacterium]